MPAERPAPDPAVERPVLTAIVLGYRAGPALVPLTERLLAALGGLGVPHEVVLVGNFVQGSDDDTPDVVRTLAETHRRVRALARPKQGGMGWDMRSGLDAGAGDWLIVIDGDQQNPVEDVGRMFELMRDGGFDVMKGRRVGRLDGFVRIVMSFVYNAAFRVLFGTAGLWDINGKPKGMTSAAHERMRLTSDDWFIDAEIVLKARRLGLRVGEMPVSFLPGTRRSFVRASAVLEFLVNMVRYRIRGSGK